MTEKKSLRGFAAMDPAKQRAIASRGGKAAHAKGTAHEFTPEEARAAGRKGGQAAHAKGTAHEFTAEEARAAGRKGGQTSHGRAGSAPLNGDQETRAPTPMNLQEMNPESPIEQHSEPGPPIQINPG